MTWYRLSDAAGWVGWTNSRTWASLIAQGRCGACSRPCPHAPAPGVVMVGVCDEFLGEPRESWQWTGAGWQRVI